MPNGKKGGIFICTAAVVFGKNALFGRNLDLEHRYGETVTVTPRNFPFVFRHMPENAFHYAMMGVAFISEGYPLYYDAINEHGLFIAALNFPESAVYKPKNEDKYNVAPFEFIPFILGSCATAKEAGSILEHVNITSTDFSENLPAAPLHWIIADEKEAFSVEPTAEKLKIHENPVGILTNEPPFEFHITNLRRYLSIGANEPQSNFSDKFTMEPFGRGFGGKGLPGDLSSDSRFIKAAFTKLNCVFSGTEEETVTQFFHVLGSVEQQEGCVRLKTGELEKTVYSSCANPKSKKYYYRTYENSRISAVDMIKENLNGKELSSYPFISKADFFMQN